VKTQVIEQRRRRGLAVSLTVGLMLTGCTRCSGETVAAPTAWRPLRTGLEYSDFKRFGAQFHVFRADLNKVALRIADARRPPRSTESVANLAGETHALVAVNGTFFDEAHKPLGWLVSEGKQLSIIHDTSWWAALIVRNVGGQPVAEVLPTEGLKALTPEERASVRFAIQVGPRTVVDGKPLKLKNQVAERTAVCVVDAQHVVVLTTKGAVSSNDLAAVMAKGESEGGLGCLHGLMLDGGPSTQLAVRTPALTLDVPGGWNVPDAVVIVPRPDVP
jgi:uncharacterized protein YigE (DUF2233 family)